MVPSRHRPSVQAWMAGPDAYESFVAGGVRALIDRSPMRYDVDVINDMEFPGGDTLLAQAEPMAARLAALKRRAKAAAAPRPRSTSRACGRPRAA